MPYMPAPNLSSTAIQGNGRELGLALFIGKMPTPRENQPNTQRHARGNKGAASNNLYVHYKQSPVLDQAALDRAFDILFKAVLRRRELNAKISTERALTSNDN
jgi:hypothetical protein